MQDFAVNAQGEVLRGPDYAPMTVSDLEKLTGTSAPKDLPDVEHVVEDISCTYYNIWNRNEEDGLAIFKALLKYLDRKEATARHLGAFSYCTAYCFARLSSDNMYIDDVHFVHRNPDYAEVYAAFGGDMQSFIVKDTKVGMRLSDEFKVPTVDLRQKRFSPDINRIFGSDGAYYSFPPPKGDDFKSMDEETLDAYISAGLGPRMLYDTFAYLGASTIYKIVNYVREKAPDIAPRIHLLKQIYEFLPVCDVPLDVAQMAANAMNAHNTAEAINQYGASFRLVWYPKAIVNQLLAIPDTPMSASKRFSLIQEVLDENGIVDMQQLSERARRLITNYVTYNAILSEVEADNVVIIDNDYKSYSPSDVFAYNLNDKLYVTTAIHLPDIAKGVGVDNDEDIMAAATARLEAKLLPARPLNLLILNTLYPRGDLVGMLNLMGEKLARK